MALNTIEFECRSSAPQAEIRSPTHLGVVGSGDLEVMMTPTELNGLVKIKIVTPVSGFDDLWQRVLNTFIDDTNLGNVAIEINDNNATPSVVTLRLRQTLAEAATKAVV